MYISLYIDILERAGDRAEHGRARGGSNADARVYARVYLSMIMCGKYILWAFCGDKLPHMTLSIKCTMSIIQSFCVHDFLLFMAFLVCFHLVFVALNVPPPYFPAGVSRLVTPPLSRAKIFDLGEGKRVVSNL